VPGTCGVCGEQVVEETNPNGSYKGACASCRDAGSDVPSHVETCERDACVVCADYRDEYGPTP